MNKESISKIFSIDAMREVMEKDLPLLKKIPDKEKFHLKKIMGKIQNNSKKEATTLVIV